MSWRPTPKQQIAFDYLNDQETTEVFFGGGAGGAKSYLGCMWLLYSCLKYPGSRWLMGRAQLKSLKESTLLTFFQICKEGGIETGVDFIYNAQASTIRFANGSDIYLKDLFAYPSDPEFDELGSTEYTGAFIDEASQITLKAKNIVMSRLRYKLEQFGILPKLLIASNPSKNFLYYEFYKPHKNKELPLYRKFVPALVGDNPFISPHYIENLKKLDKVSKERLLYGNFEYDDDPSKLFEYDKIVDMFTNNGIKTDLKYLSVDVARFGADKTIMLFWQGLYLYKVLSFSKQSTKEIEEFINKYSQEENIPRSRIVVDEDGIGGGVVDHLVGVKGFVNNSRPFDKRIRQGYLKKPAIHNFANLKSQCYWMLAEKLELAEIGVYKDIPGSFKEIIIEDLEQIKRKDPDKDGKLSVTPKDEIKEKLGRSPDFGDALMMRMYFEVTDKPGFAL